MIRITYTREQVEAAYDELKRRVEGNVREYPETHNDEDMPENIYFNMCYDMTQGLYSVIMATATNWPEVVQWIPELETKRALWRE